MNDPHIPRDDRALAAIEAMMDSIETRLQSQYEPPPPPPPPVPPSDGNGGNMGGMEARLARLESDVEYIKRDVSDIKTELQGLRKDGREDFRIIFGAIVFVTLGLAGLMAKGFDWI